MRFKNPLAAAAAAAAVAAAAAAAAATAFGLFLLEPPLIGKRGGVSYWVQLFYLRMQYMHEYTKLELRQMFPSALLESQEYHGTSELLLLLCYVLLFMLLIYGTLTCCGLVCPTVCPSIHNVLLPCSSITYDTTRGIHASLFER